MLLAAIKRLDQWMKTQATDPDLRECIYEYAMGHGRVTMESICSHNRYDGRYRLMARAQDTNQKMVTVYGRDGVQGDQGDTHTACT